MFNLPLVIGLMFSIALVLTLILIFDYLDIKYNQKKKITFKKFFKDYLAFWLVSLYFYLIVIVYLLVANNVQ